MHIFIDWIKVITQWQLFNVISQLLLSVFIDAFTKDLQTKIVGNYYHLINIITNIWSKSNHIKQLLMFIYHYIGL